MMNRFNIVGYAKAFSSMKKNEEGKPYVAAKIEVTRFYREPDEEYGRDIFEVILYGGVAEECFTHVKAGDLMGVQGYMETKAVKTSDGDETFATTFIAEKISFLNVTERS